MTVVNKDKASWYYVVSNGRDPITNKPRRFKTREEAEMAALEINCKLNKQSICTEKT